jgi:hypothetical protein
MGFMHLGLRSRTLKLWRRASAWWASNSELERLVATHTGRRINKWWHYFEIYDRHFSRLRDREITVCEIGVADGGSLEIWRRYFGSKARLVGIDIDPACQRYARPGTRIFVGSQGDADFLERVAAEVGPLDVLIDDGSHAYHHQLTTFRTLFPHIRNDGIYACEDLCTSYWSEEFGGGVRHPGSFVEFLKELIDEMNAWFWREGVEGEPATFTTTTHGLHFYPALIVIEKRAMDPPTHTPVGQPRKPAK